MRRLLSLRKKTSLVVFLWSLHALAAGSTPGSGLQPSDADFKTSLSQLRARMDQGQSHDERIQVFREFKTYLKNLDVSPKRDLFYTITRLTSYADLVNESKLDKESCANARTHILFEAHPTGIPEEQHIPGEAKEVLGYLKRLCSS